MATKSPFLKSVLKSINNEYATTVSDGLYTDNYGYIDTGCYVLNALISGSIYGGIPSNTMTGIAAPSATGKTFFLLSIVSNFLKQDPENLVFYFESEAALTSNNFSSHGIDTERVIIIPVTTIEEFKEQSFAIMSNYIKEYSKTEKKPKIFICLDSLGNLSTAKEFDDVEDGKRSVDMTKAKTIRSTFRILTNTCGLNNIPIVVTNHTYDTMSQYSPQAISGGGGFMYAATTILKLGKSQVKENGVVVGSEISVTAEKSRKTREKSKVTTFLHHKKGLDRYHGLLEIVREAEIWSYNGRQYEIDGKKYYGKTIMDDPEKFFTEDVLIKIDSFCKKKFAYGLDD